jgi:hypothetical protein
MKFNAIIAKFTNGQTVEYTKSIFHLLTTDPEVEYIIDFDTGELLYSKDF